MDGADGGISWLTAFQWIIPWALIISLSFHGFFFLSRMLSAFLLRFQRFWGPASPGVVVFLLFVEPLLVQLMQNGHIHGTTTMLYFAIIIPLTLLLLYIFPLFRGYNATFMVISSIGALILFASCLHKSHDAGGFILCHFLMVITAVLGFLTLQMRYRFFLSPDYERFHTPAVFILMAFLLLTAVALLLLFASPVFQELNPGIVPFSILSLKSPMTPLLREATIMTLTIAYVWIFQWLIMALILNFVSVYKHGGITIAFLNLSIILLVSSLFISIYQKNAPQIRGLKNDPVVSLFITLTGTLSDFDNDGFSLISGDDDNGSNPCIPYPAHRKCFKNINNPEIRYRWPFQNSSHGDRFQLTIITVYSQMSSQDILDHIRFSHMIDGVHVIRREDEDRLYLRTFDFMTPSDDLIKNLRSFIMGLTALEENAGIERSGLFSNFSDEGFRTICDVYDGGNGYGQVDSPYGLDRGCQVYRREDEQETPEAFFSHLKILTARYRETKNVVWAHYHDITNQREQLSKQIAGIVDEYSSHGPILIFLEKTDNPFVGEGLVLDTQDSLKGKILQNRSYPFWFFHELEGPKNNSTVNTGVFYHKENILCMTGIFWGNLFHYSPSLRFTYRMVNGSVKITDGLTGAVELRSVRK